MANRGSGGGGSGGAKAVEAGSAYVRIWADSTEIQAAMKRLQSRFADFGKVFAAAGAGMAAAGMSIVGPLAAIGKEVIDRDLEMKKLADRFGESTENMSKFAYAASQSGIQTEQLTDILENWPERLSDAAAGSGEASEAFSRLGLDAKKLIQLPFAEQMAQYADAVKGVANPIDQAAAVTKVFGDTGLNLLPVLKEGSAGLRALGDEAERVGAVIPTEEARQAAAAQKELSKAYAAGKNALLQFGAALLPAFDGLKPAVELFVDVAKSVREFVNENKEAVQLAFAVGAGLVAAGAAVGAVGAAFAAASTAFGGLAVAVGAVGTVLGALLTPAGLAAVAVGAVAAGLGYLLVTSEAGQAAFAELGRYFRETAATFQETWGGIANALKAGSLDLAARVAMAGLNVEFRRGMVHVTDAWNETKAVLVDGFHDAVMLAELAFNDLGAALATGIITGVDKARESFAGLMDAMSRAVNAAPVLFGPLAQGLAAANDAVGQYGAADLKAGVEANRSAEEDRIVADRRRQQEESNASRAADRSGALAAVDAAKQGLADAVRAAADAAAASAKKTAAEVAKLPPVGATARAVDITRGTFNAAAAKQLFGGQGESIMAKQLAAANATLKKFDTLIKVVEGLDLEPRLGWA